MKLLSKLRTLLTAGQGVLVGMDDAAGAADPIALFGSWFSAAQAGGLYLPESMALSTATANGLPSARMVLLKSFGPEGFVFFTNYGSRKSSEIDENPHAALLFHWGVLQRQVRVEGTVEKVSSEESDAYFASRGRGSQIGAWASRQSEKLDSRKELQGRVRKIEERFTGKSVPRPAHWGGFRLLPDRIEFWQGRADRLHDRIVFARSGHSWTSERFYP